LFLDDIISYALYGKFYDHHIWTLLAHYLVISNCVLDMLSRDIYRESVYDKEDRL